LKGQSLKQIFHFIFLYLIFFFGGSLTPTSSQAKTLCSYDSMKEDLIYFASPELDGRVSGSKGDEITQKYITQRLRCLQLQGIGPQKISRDPFVWPFKDSHKRKTANIFAQIPGSHPQLKKELIFISAHMDHLGEGHLGANDNASGISMVLSLARELKALNEKKPFPRTLVFAFFGSEESDDEIGPDKDGMEGSQYFMENLPKNISQDQIVYSINLDMVGTYNRHNQLHIYGTYPGWRSEKIIKDLTTLKGERNFPLNLILGLGDDESDQVAFCQKGIPFVFFWTEDKECYHKKCDTSDRIDFDSMEHIKSLSREFSLKILHEKESLKNEVQKDKDICLSPH
jgi:hypothetical protein